MTTGLREAMVSSPSPTSRSIRSRVAPWISRCTALLTVGRQQRGKLDEPGRGLCRQNLDDGVSAGSAAQPGDGLQHRVVGFLASIALNTLTLRDANVSRLGAGPAREGVHHRGLADPGLPGDEDDLPLASQHLQKTLAELSERALTSDQSARPWNRWVSGTRRAARQRDELVPTPREGLDEDGLLPVISENPSNLGDMALQDLGLDGGLGPPRVEELRLRDQPLRMLNQVPEDGKSLGCQQDTLVVARPPAPPEALVDRVKPKGGELFHLGGPEGRAHPL